MGHYYDERNGFCEGNCEEYATGNDSGYETDDEKTTTTDYTKDIICNDFIESIIKIVDNLDNKHTYHENIEEEIIKIDNNINDINSDSESEDDKFIKCLNCTSYIPDYISDGLCYYCDSIDKYWD